MGEVWGTDRTFNRRKPLGPIPGHHVCGSADDFERGELLDATKPPQRYLPSGLPVCCDPDRREALIPAGVRLVSRVSTDPVYRSTITASVRITTTTVRSDPYVSRICSCVRWSLRSVRSDPYVSRICTCDTIVSRTVRSDPYHSIVPVRVDVLSDATTETPESGAWSRDVPGMYTFTAEVTGPHRIRCWAAGGGGADWSNPFGMPDGGGGGGGGGWSVADWNLTAGVGYQVQVGGGGGAGVSGEDSWFKDELNIVRCLAAGGQGAVMITGGVGGQASAGIGDVRWSGGDGATGGHGTGGGGGGGAASETGDGSDAVAAVGGASPTFGGPGGDGGTASGENGHDGTGPGGGGGGGEPSGGLGGIGGGG
ncbi:MAG: hypothetical protein J0I06_06020, partial [Planctomycetes bacterium]|nr:hypothetical protein [Planctomycetota bacterium]